MIKYEYNKLRGRIVEKYGSQKHFAEALGITPRGLSKKMKGRAGFNQTDIEKWCELLEIGRSEIFAYFFN